MKAKNYIAGLLGFIAYCCLHFLLVSYDNVNSHPTFNRVFVDWLEGMVAKESSEKDEIRFLLSKDYNKVSGLGITNPGFFEATTGESQLYLTPKEWIAHGGFSADEPEVPAAVRHFYDPLGLKNGKKYLTNRGTYWEGFYPNPGIDAIEWALGDTPQGSGNKWSAAKGKEYMIQAMSEKDPTKKRELLAKAWRCLGEVLHNTADMACPPHVRNDSHAAPLGLTWGWALGSPDPYEELFNPAWITLYANTEPDPNLKENILDAETIREVHEKLAAFTNANFFSGETISGMGYKDIKPANGEKAYSSPKLDDLEYIEEEFTFYKTFPSGRRIKMCKDKGYFNNLFRNRGYPYIDRECVQSQASELIPNFMWAAAKVFGLFLPPMYVYIENIDNEGNLNGIVSSRETEEYPDEITYNGEVIILVDTKTYKTNCENGKFEISLPATEVQSAKKIQAYIDIWGVMFLSPIFKNSDYSNLKQFFLNFRANLIDEKGESSLESFEFQSTSDVNWNGNRFSHNEKKDFGTAYYNKKLDVVMNLFEQQNYVESIVYKETTIYRDSSQGFDLSDTYELTLELLDKNKIMWYSDMFKWIHLSADDFKKVLKKILYVETIKDPEYDDKGKIIGVETTIRRYTAVDFENTSDFTFVLLLTPK